MVLIYMSTQNVANSLNVAIYALFSVEPLSSSYFALENVIKVLEKSGKSQGIFYIEKCGHPGNEPAIFQSLNK